MKEGGRFRPVELDLENDHWRGIRLGGIVTCLPFTPGRRSRWRRRWLRELIAGLGADERAEVLRRRNGGLDQARGAPFDPHFNVAPRVTEHIHRLVVVQLITWDPVDGQNLIIDPQPSHIRRTARHHANHKDSLLVHLVRVGSCATGDRQAQAVLAGLPAPFQSDVEFLLFVELHIGSSPGPMVLTLYRKNFTRFFFYKFWAHLDGLLDMIVVPLEGIRDVILALITGAGR